MRCWCVFNRHVTVRDGSRDRQSGCFDPIRNDGVTHTAKMIHAVDFHDRRTSPRNLGSGSIQKSRKVLHLRFFGCGTNARAAFCERGSNHNVAGTGDRGAMWSAQI